MSNTKIIISFIIACVLFVACKKDTVKNTETGPVCTTYSYGDQVYVYDTLTGNLKQVVSGASTPIVYDISYLGNNVNISVDGNVVAEILLTPEGFALEGIYTGSDSNDIWSVGAVYNSNKQLIRLIRNHSVSGNIIETDTITNLAYSGGNLVSFTQSASGIGNRFVELSAVVTYTDAEYTNHYPFDKLGLLRGDYSRLTNYSSPYRFFAPQVFSENLIERVTYTQVRASSNFGFYLDDVVTYSYQTNNTDAGISVVRISVDRRSQTDTTIREKDVYNLVITQTCE